MTTKEKIVAALEIKRDEIESECFCKIALKGGYENFMRDFLYEGLFELGEKKLRLEYNYTSNEKSRIDLICGEPSNLDYLIELGHNGTWQSPFSVVNHAIDDINGSFDFGIISNERYTISIVTNIMEFEEKESFRFRQSYLGGIRTNRNHPERKLGEILRYFDRLCEVGLIDQIYPLLFHPVQWKGFQVDIHVFIAGSFNQTIDKQQVRHW